MKINDFLIVCRTFKARVSIVLALALTLLWVSQPFAARPYFENEKGVWRASKERTPDFTPVTERFVNSSSNISMTMKPLNESRFTHGEITLCRAVLKNTTGRAIVITGFEPVESIGCDRISLAGRLPGRVEKMPEDTVRRSEGAAGNFDCEAFRYDRSEMNYYDAINEIPRGDMTKDKFYEGFLLPGQFVTVELFHRPLSRIEKFVVEYMVAGGEYDGAAASLSPFSVYVPDKTVKNVWNGIVMRPFEEACWNSAYSSTPVVAPRGSHMSDRAVIVRGAEKSPVYRAKIDMEYDFFRDPSQNEVVFSADIARRAAAAVDCMNYRDSSLSYSSLFNGYVVHAKDACWILKSPSQRNRGDTVLPDVPASLFRDIDEKGFILVKVGAPRPREGRDRMRPGWKFWGKYEALTGGAGDSCPGVEILPDGEFIRVKRDNFRGFIEEAGERRCRLESRSYNFGMRFYEIVSPEKSDDHRK